jgi:hypothetical protein
VPVVIENLAGTVDDFRIVVNEDRRMKRRFILT